MVEIKWTHNWVPMSGTMKLIENALQALEELDDYVEACDWFFTHRPSKEIAQAEDIRLDHVWQMACYVHWRGRTKRMTNEKAMDLLDNLIGMVSDNHDGDYDEALKMGIKALNKEVKQGEWVEKQVSEIEEIVEWQSARCSYCGLYHTTPYMYFFHHDPYCPSCGAKMKTEGGSK